MKILFIGDVVGAPGREMIKEYTRKLQRKYNPTVTIINGENAAAGRGITEKIYKGFLEAGVHAVTLGNHVWDNRDIFNFIDDANALIRPLNYPTDTPGRGYAFIKVNNIEVAIINVLGRTFLAPLDCPFQKIDEILPEIRKRTPYIIVDFHAEATSEKEAMGWYLDGRVSAVIGTHTHVQTADERILPDGTGYITDVGMTGPYDGILGMNKEAVLYRFLTSMPARFEVDTGRAQLNGVVIHMNRTTGQAEKMSRIIISEDHPFYE